LEQHRLRTAPKDHADIPPLQDTGDADVSLSTMSIPARKPEDRRRITSPVFQIPKKFGGAYRDRTDDLMLAKHALSQLS
jgi:hypothetical protein